MCACACGRKERELDSVELEQHVGLSPQKWVLRPELCSLQKKHLLLAAELAIQHHTYLLVRRVYCKFWVDFSLHKTKTITKMNVILLDFSKALIIFCCSHIVLPKGLILFSLIKRGRCLKNLSTQMGNHTKH